MTTIKLYGRLGRKFGRVHRFHLDRPSPAEAVRALRSQFPELEPYLRGYGPGFHVYSHGMELPESALNLPSGQSEIRFVPAVAGASGNNPSGNILAGIALVVASYYTFGAVGSGALLQGAGWAGVGTAVSGLGYSLAIGGVSRLIAGTQPFDPSRNGTVNRPSYLFNGVVNTTTAGGPVPVCYGRYLI